MRGLVRKVGAICFSAYFDASKVDVMELTFARFEFALGDCGLIDKLVCTAANLVVNIDSDESLKGCCNAFEPHRYVTMGVFHEHVLPQMVLEGLLLAVVGI